MQENDTLDRETTHSAPSETPEAPDTVTGPPAPEDNGGDLPETGAAADSPAGETPPAPKEEKEPTALPAKPPDKEASEPPEDPETALKRWIAEDAAAFVEAYPEADLAKLDGDARFRRFCGSRYAKSGTVITKASGGTPSAGDEYEVYGEFGDHVRVDLHMLQPLGAGASRLSSRDKKIKIRERANTISCVCPLS